MDPSKVVKGNVIWSDNPNELSVQVTSPSLFKIITVRLLYVASSSYPGPEALLAKFSSAF